jgi:non-specific serine/threonine protein kinase
MIAQALGLTDEAAPTPTTATVATTGLSLRELEIAQLVADGFSNKEIAARLLISARTVDTHVDHILKKLGLRSRAQVALALIATSWRGSTHT